jgi:predicted MPP superfamily phosphohydrolase
VIVLSRRQVLKALVAAGLVSTSFGGYALAEPFRLGVTQYAVSPPEWPSALTLRVAVITDLHICEPWMGLDRLTGIVAHTNALEPDVVLLLGDYVRGGRMVPWSRIVPHDDWAAVLARLKAPLGVHAVLGNHDWWEDAEALRRGDYVTRAGVALERAGIPVHQNTAVRLEKEGQPFWIAGLGDQWAFHTIGSDRGFDDLAGTLDAVTDDAPVILMAHEPDIFPLVPSRVALTLAGHTHGGQVTLAGFAPIIPSKYGQRYRYGQIVEDGRNMIVSAGLGCSKLPVRFGAPPEIVLVTLGSGSNIA